MDLDDTKERCNIQDWLQDEHDSEIIREFIYQNRFSKFIFATGYRFYYWEYYRDKHFYDVDVTGGRNENDHSGFTPSQLFVVKNKDLKDRY